MWRDVVIALAPAWPALGALVIGAVSLRRRDGTVAERLVVGVATVALGLSLASALFACGAFLATGLVPIDVRLGHWFRAGDYGFALAFLIDGISAPMSLLAAILVLATSKFSAAYLHREPGFARFFILTLVFGSGIQLVAIGGSIELIFAGWELVGIASFLLVGFFRERVEPTKAAIRVLVTYRLCDVGLVVAGVLLHELRDTTLVAELSVGRGHGDAGAATLLALGILVAAMGKSAQFPVGGWLPRAMEGPTASSAVFYGGLSVHAGVFLLARLAPLYMGDPIVRIAIVLVGGTTAVFAALSGQVSADAKTALAYATAAQVGLMFVECGLGFPGLAMVHLSAHALLRYYQFLRTPSVLQDALARRADAGAEEAERTRRWQVLGVGMRRFLYRLAIERFEVEATLERWIARPALTLARTCDDLERRIFDDAEEAAPVGDEPPSSRDVGFVPREDP
jgi:NADH:ubiquinone oxidoreductase subunit 5 (subunit L)/multisubunit Na+/H+ antiporter MnhA subunit